MLQAAKNHRHIMDTLILALLFAVLLILPAGATAGAEEGAGDEQPKDKGWIEVTAEVPEGFNSAVIATVTHTETQEEYDIQLLEANGYSGKRQIPYGEYTAEQAFVPADIRFGGIPKSQTFQITGKESAAVEIVYQVDILDAYKEEANAPAEDEEQPVVTEEPTTESGSSEGDSSDSNEADDSAKEESEDTAEVEQENNGENSSSRSTLRLLRNIALSIFATIIFAGLIALAVLIVRSRILDED